MRTSAAEQAAEKIGCLEKVATGLLSGALKRSHQEKTKGRPGVAPSGADRPTCHRAERLGLWTATNAKHRYEADIARPGIRCL